MRCKGCEYPLWDLKARVCPECGLGFSPVDYEFVINSVRFMCPHCRQAYYGTGEKGHLVPQRFLCVKCGTEVDEAEMVLLPTVGVSDSQTVGGVVAWRERAKRGKLSAFFVTIGQAAFSPHRLARFCGETVNWVEAWVFGGVAIVCYALLSVGWCGGLMAFSSTMRLGMQSTFSDIVSAVAQAAGWLAAPVVAAAVLTVLWAGSAHVVLNVWNAKGAPFRRTLECFGYAWGAGFLMAVPCFGLHLSPVALVWVTVSAIIQMQVRHGVSVSRAVWAGLLLPLLVASVFALWVGLLIVFSR